MKNVAVCMNKGSHKSVNMGKNVTGTYVSMYMILCLQNLLVTGQMFTIPEKDIQIQSNKAMKSQI